MKRILSILLLTACCALAQGPGYIGSGVYVTGNSNLNVLGSINTPNQVDAYGMLSLNGVTSTNTLTLQGVYYHIADLGQLRNENGMATTVSNITVLSSGVYDMRFIASFSGTGNQTYEIAIFTNNTEVVAGEVRRKLGASGDVGSVSGGLPFMLSSNTTIDLRVECTDTAGAIIRLERAGLAVTKHGH